VAVVPVTRTRPPRGTALSAATAPGSITPSTGTGEILRIDDSASEEAVLQATISNLIFFFSRKAVISFEKEITASGDFVP